MNIGQTNWTRVRQAMREAVRGWMYDPNVGLIDFGWRESGGILIEDELAIRVHVVEKIASGLALEVATQKGITRGPIPKEIAGIPVDIPQGDYRLHQGYWGSRWWGSTWSRPATTNPRARRMAPMQGGISISNAYQNIYGTLGGLVIDASDFGDLEAA